MKFIPLKVHQVLDFIVGIALILAPNIFGFTDVGGAAVWIPRVIGIASIVLGLVTDGYGFSVVKLIPLKIHLWMDLLAGILLAASPWLFGFSDEKAKAWVPHLVVGLALVVVSQTTQITYTKTAAAKSEKPAAKPAA